MCTNHLIEQAQPSDPELLHGLLHPHVTGPQVNLENRTQAISISHFNITFFTPMFLVYLIRFLFHSILNPEITSPLYSKNTTYLQTPPCNMSLVCCLAVQHSCKEQFCCKPEVPRLFTMKGQKLNVALYPNTLHL